MFVSPFGIGVEVVVVVVVGGGGGMMGGGGGWVGGLFFSFCAAVISFCFFVGVALRNLRAPFIWDFHIEFWMCSLC